jgi:hypothetical protein
MTLGLLIAASGIFYFRRKATKRWE